MISFEPVHQEPQSSDNEDEDLLLKFVHTNPEVRLNLLLNHPKIFGFVYIVDGILTKAFLPKKSVDWTKNREYIAAVSGNPHDYTPFSVPGDIISGDTPHLHEPVKLHSTLKSSAPGKFIVKNRKDLRNLPEEARTDAKAKSLRIVNFPIVLPLIKGLKFDEGPVTDKTVCETFEKTHELYEDFLHLKVKTSMPDESFFDMEEDCPMPDTIAPINLVNELPLKVLFKHHDAYPILKSEIDKLLSIEKPAPSPVLAPNVPNEVAILDHKTVVTSASSTQDVKLLEKNERLIAFLSIFFSRPEYDRSGNIAALTPAQLTDEALELLATHSSTADQARALYDGLDALATDISRERTYLNRAADLPYLSQTVLTYMLQTHFHLHAIDKNHDSLKKSFNWLSFLPPPSSSNDDYSKYMNASRNAEVEQLLDQPQEKRSAIKKDVFTKGRQDNIDDVLTFVANILVFARFWVKMSDNTSSSLKLCIITYSFLKLQSSHNTFYPNSTFYQRNQRSFKCTLKSQI